jgi:DNA-binding XRE family transcriptional regulator
MNLKVIREKLRISQAELGKLARVRRVHILSHEKGYRPLDQEEMHRVTRACMKESAKLIVCAVQAKRLCVIRVKSQTKKPRKAA